MKKITLFATLAILLLSIPAHAILPAPKTGMGLVTAFGTDDYRLGDEWGKKEVNLQNIGQASPQLKRAAMATAHLSGATGFYLGKFNGQHVMATNHHVFPSPGSCGAARNIRFPLLGITVSCDQFLGTWDEIDLALFTVKVASPEDEAKLHGVAANFQFNDDVRMGEKILTVGFGVAGNPNSALMANQDSDCYVFSKDGEYRLMADPDQWNPGEYRAWSFATGCDVSHGDSGSAMVDRDNGKVVGIIWTGRIPKSEQAQKTSYLNEIFKSQDNAIWEELSYAVPAKKMGEFLNRLLQSGLPENYKQIISALLLNQAQ
ncbi:MAG: S1 family peptidase [Bdellovibrionota bacterium]